MSRNTNKLMKRWIVEAVTKNPGMTAEDIYRELSNRQVKLASYTYRGTMSPKSVKSILQIMRGMKDIKRVGPGWCKADEPEDRE